MTEIGRIKSVLEFLFDRWTVILNRTEATVWDGQPIGRLGYKGVAVGWAPDELGVTAEDEPGGLSDDRVKFNVVCSAWARTGDQTPQPARDQVGELLDLIEEDIAHDPQLERRLTRAKLRFIDLEQFNNTDGTWAFVVFTIGCDAFH